LIHINKCACGTKLIAGREQCFLQQSTSNNCPIAMR
jgi:hypothetical protein